MGGGGKDTWLPSLLSGYNQAQNPGSNTSLLLSPQPQCGALNLIAGSTMCFRQVNTG